ncbi:hypothetical protein EW146_g7915 [Bondarzewia mesenterica]|uniref:Uncharacterized protein n=1 Tax=Bondarzewia mesenterica TaxID=1095465 RepID=A0A4S4LIN6_9AGAM|nr:hypothetical protein EW146_g7915 [Bondarzewia mesenterica]
MLSEQLQLLYELSYSDLNMPYRAAEVHSNRDIIDSDLSTDGRILDIIAISLTTGEPGDVVAATFDRHKHLGLVLAKNGRPTLEDENATACLIAAITDHATESRSLLLSAVALPGKHGSADQRSTQIHLRFPRRPRFGIATVRAHV